MRAQLSGDDEDDLGSARQFGGHSIEAAARPMKKIRSFIYMEDEDVKRDLFASLAR